MEKRAYRNPADEAENLPTDKEFDTPRTQEVTPALRMAARHLALTALDASTRSPTTWNGQEDERHLVLGYN
jgi:hypothetical protein